MSRRPVPLPRRRVLTADAAAGVVRAVWPAPPPAPRAGGASIVRLGRREMGSVVEVLLPGGASVDAAMRALDEVSAIARRFTAFDAGSEVGALNAQAAQRTIAVAPDLFDLLTRARALSEWTGGAFDIASGALWRAWGFMPPLDDTGRAGISVDEARRRSGMTRVSLDDRTREVAFTTDGVEINLGAIGKGYAVDRASDVLRRTGVDAGLVHAGHSSIRAWGDAPGSDEGAGWPVSVRHPGRAAPLATLHLRDRAMGVSGVAERFVDRDGVRLGHVIDPRSGAPASHHVLTVAWASDATTADALSTAFFVMTHAEIAAFCAANPDVGALIVPSGGDVASAAAIGRVPPSLVMGAR